MSLTYQDALDLKEAGFPQKHIHPCDLCNDGDKECPIAQHNEASGAYSPTLEELIDACGYDLLSLSRQPDGRWMAYSRVDDGHGNNIETIFPTPIQAVKNLYCALKKK